MESMERHGHLDLDPEVRKRLLSTSAATLDLLLKPIRTTVASRRKRRRNLQRGRHIPVRTFPDWDRPPQDFLEIDLVAHCGDNMGGSFIHSLVATDVCTGWTEAVPLLAREQCLVVTGLEAITKHLPLIVRGIDSDNDSDSVFINDILTQYCVDRGIEFTHSRAYRKNDQAWIEQKNGAVIRRYLGLERYSGQVAGLSGRCRQDESASSQPRKVRAPRTWRTRPDPFERVWCEVLEQVAGRLGRQRGGIAGQVAVNSSGPVQSCSSAHSAAPRAKVARHHGKQTGLRCTRRNHAGPTFTTGIGARSRWPQVLRFG